ncbi:MAG: hypothetical protein DNFNHJIP_00042 [Candidatus Argoarchaeum ethanivorans]|uniref:Uncharacterized protein n=1 Tax=Candidatus Argoarchaeum ethanivorans TaxID=2608793 RepID=A0A812A0I2_9EURY|nr:MAG: hypothetical protein DNFNHJIP_00042 [Candidatus Argoarchaeum ethanivorans]
MVDSKDLVNFVMLFTLRESRRAPDSAFSRVRSSTLPLHPFSLDSEALRLLQRWGTDNKQPKAMQQATDNRQQTTTNSNHRNIIRKRFCLRNHTNKEIRRHTTCKYLSLT